jgi:hypothetical protein
MDKPTEPRQFMEVQPGEDLWAAMARELATNPDSTASLHIQSFINRAVKSRADAALQLVEALACQIEGKPEPGAQAGIDAAIAYWEKTCGGNLPEALMKGFRKDAGELAQRRRRQPPPLESILVIDSAITDVGYEMGVHLQGVRGTWHRLWASISSVRLWGDSPEQHELVQALRAQFEALLGRAISQSEWKQLTEHANRHSDKVMKPLLQNWEESGEGEAG